MPHVVQPLPFSSELVGISKKTVEIHHDKLYAGYVAKRNEVEEAITQADATKANQVYSAYRGLKEGETFAANGMVLHQVHFSNLGGNGDPAGTKVHEAIVATWGSWEAFVAALTATAMAARGWAILAFDPSDSKLHLYAADAQNQGGVWGCTPLLCLDVYEHAYFIDVGSDRPTYIKNFLQNINWQDVDSRYVRASAS
ncbi:MAG: superoxide dismutase [Patescibacteria group bacterium]